MHTVKAEYKGMPSKAKSTKLDAIIKVGHTEILCISTIDKRTHAQNYLS